MLAMVTFTRSIYFLFCHRFEKRFHKIEITIGRIIGLHFTLLPFIYIRYIKLIVVGRTLNGRKITTQKCKFAVDYV